MSSGSQQRANWRRGARYGAVGVLGTCVKLGALTILHDAFGAGCLAATAVAVESSMLHNFAWHARWTWRDRTAASRTREMGRRLLRFQFGNGAVAMAVNLVSMPTLTGDAGLSYPLAGLVSSLLGGAVNFLLSDLWVFAARGTARSWSLPQSPPATAERLRN